MGEVKTVEVVGGASGIGKATARRLCQRGYRVIVTDAGKDRLEALDGEWRERAAPGLATMLMDITDSEMVRAVRRRITQQFGRLDGLVISAGVHSTYPVEYLPDHLIHRVLDVNLIAHIKLVRDTLPVLNDRGRIVGVSSIAAGLGVPMSSVYSASKAGLEVFYESLAAEVAYRRIRAILIRPGNVDTGFNETGNGYRPTGNRFIDSGYERVVAAIHSSRGMDPDDVARVIVAALEARTPRFCTVVGGNARKAYWAERVLGRDVALRLMARYFGF